MLPLPCLPKQVDGVITTAMNRSQRIFFLLLSGATLLGSSGCLRIKSDPIRIEPIRIDVFINVERDLDELFLELDRQSQTMEVDQ